MYPDVSNFQKERKLVCSVNYSHQIPMEKLLANFIFRLLSLSQESRQKIGLVELGFNGLVETFHSCNFHIFETESFKDSKGIVKSYLLIS